MGSSAGPNKCQFHIRAIGFQSARGSDSGDTCQVLANDVSCLGCPSDLRRPALHVPVVDCNPTQQHLDSLSWSFSHQAC